MIAITAATGQLGRLVVANLLTRVAPSEIVLLAHQPDRLAAYAAQGVQVRRGDFKDSASLLAAFEGVDRLLFISSPEMDSDVRIAQHRSVIEAAGQAGVGHIIYTSSLGVDEDGPGIYHVHYTTEKLLRESGLPYTALRNPLYTEVFINPSLKAAVEAGELTGATGGRAINTATRADLAVVAAVVATGEVQAGQIYNLTGPLWTYPQLAEALSQVSGRPVAYRELAEPSGPYGWLFDVIRSGALEYSTTDLAQLLGRPGITIEQAVVAIGEALR